MSGGANEVEQTALLAALERVARQQPPDVLRGRHLGTAGGIALADAMRAAVPSMVETMDLYGCGLADGGTAAIAAIGAASSSASHAGSLSTRLTRRTAALLSRPQSVRETRRTSPWSSQACRACGPSRSHPA